MAVGGDTAPFVFYFTLLSTASYFISRLYLGIIVSLDAVIGSLAKVSHFGFSVAANSAATV